MTPQLSNTYLDRSLGHHQMVGQDGVIRVWELYYEYGEGNKSVFHARWGRQNAKKMQHKSLSWDEAYAAAMRHKKNGYKHITNIDAIKVWSEMERISLTTALGGIVPEMKKKRKL